MKTQHAGQGIFLKLDYKWGCPRYVKCFFVLCVLLPHYWINTSSFLDFERYSVFDYFLRNPFETSILLQLVTRDEIVFISAQICILNIITKCIWDRLWIQFLHIFWRNDSCWNWSVFFMFNTIFTQIIYFVKWSYLFGNRKHFFFGLSRSVSSIWPKKLWNDKNSNCSDVSCGLLAICLIGSDNPVSVVTRCYLLLAM